MAEAPDEVVHATDLRGKARLWFGMLGPALAWAIGFSIDYGLVRVACARQNMIPLHLVTLLTLAVVVTAGIVAHREWRRAGGGEPTEGGGPIARARFMGMFGMLAGAFFALLVLAQWAPKLFLNPCMGI
ncbi:MAG TPA: hypothetical protein VFJ82_26750 [Longimicrobium sp.]|nr:hypothetical protein [Longimicrobium sp.]